MSQTFWARTDSNSANNPALNLTGDPATQITFVPSGSNGDLFLDYNGGAPDPDTQVDIAGTSYDFIFELSATLPTLKKDGAQQVPDQFEGSIVYTITVQDYPTTGETTRLTFLPDETASQADMDAFGTGAVDLQNIDTITTGVVCFGEGTLIDTPDGPRAVEELAAGDLVTTLDHGAKPILWISKSSHVWPGSSENALPIQIRAGALGPGMPARDLVVSPQHKVLLAESTNPDDGILGPAKGLTSRPGIRVMRGKRAITYYHVLLEAHEILLSEGLPSESFYPGPQAMKMLKYRQRNAVLTLFPKLKINPDDGYGPHARPCLTVQEVLHNATMRISTRVKNTERRKAA